MKPRGVFAKTRAADGMQSPNPALPLTKGELEGVRGEAAAGRENPPQSPLGKGGSQTGWLRDGVSSGSRASRRGFTLIELLVVITIILIVSVASLPVVLPAMRQQSVSNAALLLNAELSRARDEAVRDNKVHGLRFLPDRDGRFTFFGATPAYSRMIPIEMGPDYSEGAVRLLDPNPLGNPSQVMDAAIVANVFHGDSAYLWPVVNTCWRTIWESKYSLIDFTVPFGIPRSPTSWYWNIRQGDKIRLNKTGKEYTIVGPMLVGPSLVQNQNNAFLLNYDKPGSQMSNPERYINWGSPNSFISSPTSTVPPSTVEFLIVLDGVDNDNDGYVDEQWDGVDNDGDGHTDPGFNGLDDNGNGYVDEPAEAVFGGALVPVTVGGEFEPESSPVLPTLDTQLDPVRATTPSCASRWSRRGRAS